MILLFLFFILSRTAAICVDTFPGALDFGYYWASPGSGSDPVVWEKSCPGELPASFSLEKESKVFYHGLQPGAVIDEHRFFLDDEDINPAALAYLGLGYNFGVFLWTQFADEPLTNFIRAEGKLNATDFVAAMNYVYIDKNGDLEISDGPAESVSQLAYIHYLAHWGPGLNPNPPHIIGHSLGSQLVVYLAETILTGGGSALLPRRVTLLDPVFSDSAKPYLRRNNCGLDISSVLGCYMGQLVDAGVAVELYRSSFINRCIFSSDNNAQMVLHSAAVALKLTKWGSVNEGYCWNSDLLSHFSSSKVEHLGRQITEQHRAVIEWYIRSGLEASAPRICKKRGDQCDPTRTMAPSGAASDEDILRWAREDPKKCFFQFPGLSTKNSDPSDDLFYVDDCFAFNK